MTVEVIGIDHVYVTVRDLESSEAFYDRVMGVLRFRKGRGSKGRGTIGGDATSISITGNMATR